MSSAVRAAPVPSVGPDRDDPIRGILLILSAIVVFSGSDALAKYLAASMPVVEIVWLRYTTFMLLMLPLVVRGGTASLRSVRPGLQLLRGLGILGSSTLFVAGLRYLPLADATAIGFVSPLFITALSIPVLGERVGPRRWIAIGIGLVGVLIIVRPGATTFQPAAVFPLLSSISWACAIVITRKMSGADGMVTTLAYSALGPFLITSIALPWFWVTPSLREIAFGLVYGTVATAAQWLVVMAYRYAGASVLAPLTYSQLVWSTALGFIVFAAIPDAQTFLGAGVIIVSGLYTAHRERVRAREQAAVLRSAALPSTPTPA
jgi:drug/metabolite transporter (DMT)-like permease